MTARTVQKVTIAAPEFKYFADFPEGFRAGIARPALAHGRSDYGDEHLRVASGPSEEWLLVLAGRPTLRHPEGEEGLEPWDVVFFPPGPGGAHAVRNDSDSQLAC